MKKSFCDVASDWNIFLILNEMEKDKNHEILPHECVCDHVKNSSFV